MDWGNKDFFDQMSARVLLCNQELPALMEPLHRNMSAFVCNCNLFWCFLTLQVSSSNATTISQPILQLSGDSQAHVAQVAQGQDLNAAGQTLQSVQLVNPGTFLIQAQTVTATGQIQWQTFQVTCSFKAEVSYASSMLCFRAVKDVRLLTSVPSLSAGSGCPVTPGAPVAPGAGSGPTADFSPGPDPPSGSDRPSQPAQPPDSHGELCNTKWSSVHTRGWCKQSSWYGTPAHTPHPHTQFFIFMCKS